MTPEEAEIEAINRELKGVQFRAVTACTRIKEDVAKLDSTSSKSYGTSQQRDTKSRIDVQRRLKGNVHRFGELANEFKRLIEKHPDRNGLQAQKILRDFQGLLQRSEDVMKRAKQKEQEEQKAAEMQRVQSELDRRGGDIESIDVEGERVEVEKIERIDNEIRFNEAIVEERDQAITEITGQIGEVHQIFQDLAVLVHDQGDMVDDIEANLTRAVNRTADAHTQLIRAERSQRKSRNTWCFMAMLAGGAIFILFLIAIV